MPKPVKGKKKKSTKTSKAEKLLTEVEDLLKTDGPGTVLPKKRNGANNKASRNADAEVLTTPPVDADNSNGESDIHSSTHETDTVEGDEVREQLHPSGDSEPATQGIPFDDIVQALKDDPYRAQAVALEQTAMMAEMARRQALALERIATHLSGIESVAIMVADYIIRVPKV